MATSQRFANMSQEDKRRYWNIYNHRARKRRKFNKEIAKFIKALENQQENKPDEQTMLLINEELKQIAKLPRNWTDNDLERAKRSLDSLSKQYLNHPFYKLSSDEALIMTECLAVLDNTDMDTRARVNVLYNLLRQEVQKLFLHEMDKQAPTPQNALLFLTQDLSYSVPGWFNQALLELLEEKYQGEDFNDFLRDLRYKMQTDKKNLLRR